MNVRAIGLGSDPAQDVAVAGISIAPGLVALMQIAVTRTITTSAAAANGQAVQLLAANNSRLAATIRNDATTNLHVDSAAIVQGPPSGEYLVAPGQYVEVNESNKGVVDGWWEGAPTGQATVAEFT